MVDDERVLSRFCSFFGEERTISISHFLVCKTPVSGDSKIFLKVLLNSLVGRPVLPLPRHCFNIVTIPQVAAGYTDNCGLFGKLALYFFGLKACAAFFPGNIIDFVKVFVNC